MKRFPTLRKAMVWLTAVVALLLLLTCYLYYRPVAALPILDSLGSLVPMLWVANGFFFLFWLLQRDGAALWPALALGVSLLAFENYYRLGGETPEPVAEGLKVMSYNARSLGFNRRRKNVDLRDSILSFIKQEDPDILVLQEFTYEARKFLVRDYPYHYATPRETGRTLQAIFSRYPMVGSGMVEFPDSRNNTLYADIALKSDTIRVYNVHLQSYNIGSRRFLLRGYGTRFLGRLSVVAQHHREQTDLIREHLARSPHPVLVCGDFNSPPFSNTYRRLKEGFQDTYAAYGRGLGTTYSLKGIPYRIDYILADSAFAVRDHRNYPVRLSDHFPLMATLALKAE